MHCKSFKKRISDYLDASLSAPERKDFESHREVCPNCASELKAFEAILTRAKSMEQVTPPDVLWERIVSELEAPRVPFYASPADRMARLKARLQDWRRVPAPAYTLAGAIAVLLIGVVLGRYFFPNGNDGRVARQIYPSDPEIQMVANRTNNFVEKSKILFLGFVNTDTTEARSSDWTIEKRVAQKLVNEAAALKEDLSRLRSERLKLLIEELELILLEIANLEKEHDLENIELIKSGIDHQGLLLKINLHDMSDQPLFAPVPPSKKVL